jgi:hypothetical protein
MLPAEPIPEGKPRFLPPQDTAADGFQDFILMNQPVFFAPDVASATLWFKTARLGSPASKALGMLALAFRRGGFRQAALLARTVFTRLSHPFGAEFHSTTPYKLGDRHVAKYSLKAKEPERFRGPRADADPDALNTALRDSLRERAIELQFFVHVFHMDAIPEGLGSLSEAIEDATIDWRQRGARTLHVANIRIPVQDPATLERMAQAQAIAFNPWNALVEHRPLGSLNRARWAVYRASQSHRAAASGGNGNGNGNGNAGDGNGNAGESFDRAAE